VIWVLERLSMGFSCPISLETTSYIHIYIYVGGPSFPLCYPKTTWTHHHIIYVWGTFFSFFVLSKNHLDPSSYYIRLGAFFPSYHPKETSRKSNAFFEAYENLNFGRFHVLAALIWGTTHNKNFKVQLNS
jgi:hypothetical protein